MPTHLFKFMFSLGHLTYTSGAAPPSAETTPPPTVLPPPTPAVFGCHNTVTASLAPVAPTITFRLRARQSGDERQWSDATDVTDFPRDAAQVTKLTIRTARLVFLLGRLAR